MSSPSYELDSNSSSSSNDSLSLTKQLLVEPLGDDTSSARKTLDSIQTSTIHICTTVSGMLVNRKRPHGGSILGRHYIRRDREECNNLILNDYFKSDDSKYKPEHFLRRFRMDFELFKKNLHGVESYGDYFTQKVDAVGKRGLSPLQKVLAEMRMLAYGCPADLVDEYIQIGESAAIESLQFCDAIIRIYENKYLRKPNKDDIVRLLKEGEARGFSGMFESLDCMHWHWKNCPMVWHGTYTNGLKKSVYSYFRDCSFSRFMNLACIFWYGGTNNDVTVLDQSPLFDDIINDVAPSCEFVIQGHQYNMGYYLSDGMYPEYATLIQTISHPSSIKEKLFAEHQESVRKDVERAFGVLQSRWHIFKGPSRMWNANDLGKIMKTCIILHNVTIESEHSQGIDPENWQPGGHEVEDVIPYHDYTFLVSRMISRTKQVQYKRVHKDLKMDLINHLWEVYGGHQVV